MRRALRTLFLFLVVVTVVPLVSGGTVLAALLFLPLPATLPEPLPGVDSQISRVYDVAGNEIAVFRRFETTKPVEPEDIPEVLEQAVVAAEDRRFYDHGGVDVLGTARALWADIRAGEVVQGGSTITQQYVKNTYTGGERSLDRKVREALLASQLDRQVDKDEILYRYLQQIYLGEGAYGVGAAAETYFRKPVNDLTLSESALLAGLIPAPSRWHPRLDIEKAEQRRRLVLDAMLGEGYITEAEHKAASTQTAWFGWPEAPPTDRAVTVVQPREATRTPYPYFVDYLERYLIARYGEDALYRGGLQVHTTLDPRLQAEAERSVAETLDGTAPPLEMSLVAVEPPTGFVRALVGGRDFAASQVNLALGVGGGGSGRQPGSTFKTFVLAEAFRQGVSPSRRYSGASPLVVGADDFSNYGGDSYGTVDLRAATAKSVNTVFVQLIEDVGVQETMDLARQLGITTSVYRPEVHGLSIALGALDVSPLDMASAYGVFAARGERAEPTPVLRVIDADGVVLEDHSQAQRRRVLPEVVADNVNDLLQGVLGPGGTAAGRGLDRPAAGKTGTAQDNSNAWFVGYTPTLSTAVWMGYSDTPRPMRGIKGVAGVTGGSFPARTWESFMEAAVAGVPVTDFTEPAPIEPVADNAQLTARGGFGPGGRRLPAGSDAGGPYVVDLPAPRVEPPPTTAPSPPVP